MSAPAVLYTCSVNTVQYLKNYCALVIIPHTTISFMSLNYGVNGGKTGITLLLEQIIFSLTYLETRGTAFKIIEKFSVVHTAMITCYSLLFQQDRAIGKLD